VVGERVATVNDLPDGHVALDIQCLDRDYLNAYVRHEAPFYRVGGGAHPQGGHPLRHGVGRRGLLRQAYRDRAGPDRPAPGCASASAAIAWRSPARSCRGPRQATTTSGSSWAAWSCRPALRYARAASDRVTGGLTDY